MIKLYHLFLLQLYLILFVNFIFTYFKVNPKISHINSKFYPQDLSLFIFSLIIIIIHSKNDYMSLKIPPNFTFLYNCIPFLNFISQQFIKNPFIIHLLFLS